MLRTVCSRTHNHRQSVRRLVNMSDINKSEGTETRTGGDRLSGDYRPDYPWKKVKKCAAMLSFSGKNYHGMQRNQVGEIKTIESEFLAALSKSGTIDPLWEHKPQVLREIIQ